MKPPRATVELLVIGAGAAGLAAAACAARSGAKAALAATGEERPEEGAVIEPPNAVWRLLDLHTYDLKFEGRAGVASFLADGKAPLTISDDAAASARDLAARDPTLEQIWPAFIEDMRRARDNAAGAGLEPDRFQTANAALDDYFGDEALKTHVIAALVAPFGLAGDEAGSMAALLSAGAPPPRRLAASALAETLKSAAEAAGVEIAAGKLQRLSREGKLWKALMEDGREIRARRAMASSALLAEAAGLRIAAPGAALLRRAGAEATIRIRYDRKPKSPFAQAAALAATDRASIIAARNAMLEGRLPDESPLLFEFRGKDILARAPFCPAQFRENGEARDWTGQDKQILGRQAAALIERRLGGAPGVVRDIEVTIGPDVAAGLRRRRFSLPPLPAPAPSPDAIGAAAALALEIIRDD